MAAAPALGPVGMIRWAWRQLTSMRTALMLLLLLAVAAVPGSLFPQRASQPTRVTQYLEQHPDIGPWLDGMRFFDVYTSPWFSAIYLLLFVSLIGCVLPRTRQLVRQLRTRPPRTPRRLERLPAHRTVVLGAGPDGAAADGPGTVVPAPSDVAARGRALLARRRYRADLLDEDGDAPSVAAERGYLREAGNLVFHVAMIGVLAAVAAGGLFGYTGQRVLVEGDTFVNSLVDYDSFSPGGAFSADRLAPYSVRLDRFHATFETQQGGSQFGQPRDYRAYVTTRAEPGAAARSQVLRVNHPLSLGGTDVYLTGNGYAPVVTVRDGTGKVAFSGPTVFLPQDKNLTSLGVIKVPDAKPEQLGLVGFLLPTAVTSANGTGVSAFPTLTNTYLTLNVFSGDLGVDDGVPRNVYALDTSGMTPVLGRQASHPAAELRVGQSTTLPDGLGSIRFDGVRRYVALDVHHDPAKGWALGFALAALAGLGLSLFVPRRRVWLRSYRDRDGRTVVEVAALARGEDVRLGAEVDAVLAGLLADLPGAGPVGTDGTAGRGGTTTPKTTTGA